MMLQRRRERVAFNRLIFVQIGLALVLWLVSACRSANVMTVQVKSATTGEKNLIVKSSYAFAKTFTLPSGGTVAAYDLFLANYEIDTRFAPRNINMPTNGDEMLVEFSLMSDVDSTATSPTLGTYAVKPEFGPAGNPNMRIPPVSVQIVSFQSGVQNKNRLDKKGLTGTVTIKSVSGDMVIGEINLTASDTSVKGPFTSKIVVSEK